MVDEDFGLMLVAVLVLYVLSVVITVYVFDSDDEGSRILVFFGLLAVTGVVWNFVDDVYKRRKQRT